MTTDTRPRPPLPLLLALLLVLVEVGALAALAGGMLVELLGGGTLAPLVTTVTALVFAAIIALLLAGIRALYRGRRWGRGPIITWQLLVLAIGVSQATTLAWWLAGLLVVLPIAVTVGLLLPASVTWTDTATPPRAVL